MFHERAINPTNALSPLLIYFAQLEGICRESFLLIRDFAKGLLCDPAPRVGI